MKNLGVKNLGMKNLGMKKLGVKNLGMKNVGVKKTGCEKSGGCSSVWDAQLKCVQPGYYKGVDASNVNTKKLVNENCHFWANFN